MTNSQTSLLLMTAVLSLLLLSLGCEQESSQQDISELVSSCNQFTFETIKALPDSGLDVWVGSGFSLGRALKVLHNGAEGATNDSLARVLKLPDLPSETLNQCYRDLGRQLEDTTNVQLNIATALWLASTFNVKPDFVRSARNYFSADLLQGGTVENINSWVSGKTQGRIPEITKEIGAFESLRIYDVLYFMGKWEKVFNKRDTEPGTFFRADGKKVLTPFMQHNGDGSDFPESFRYLETDQFQGMALPYEGGRVSMVVIKPKVDIGAFLRSLDNGTWEKWMSQYKPVKTILGQEGLLLFKMPKVKFEGKFNYEKLLQRQGLGIVFDSTKARFTGITDYRQGGNLYCQEILQKTLLEIDEEKTLAIAVTESRMVLAGPSEKHSPPIVLEMIVDHPYLMAIQDNQTGLILFTAVVRNLDGILPKTEHVEVENRGPNMLDYQDSLRALSPSQIRLMQKEAPVKLNKSSVTVTETGSKTI